MATPIELAVIEMQIIVREMNKRMGGIERRLGIEPEPMMPAGERPRGLMAMQSRPVAQRTAAGRSEAYEVKGEVPPVAGAAKAQAEFAPPQSGSGAGGEIGVETKVGDRSDTLKRELRADDDTLKGGLQTVMQSPVGETFSFPKATGAGAAGSREIPVRPAPVRNTPPSAVRVMEFLESHVPAEAPQSTLERTLGVEVASWLGAFAIMGGMLFFLKLAMDNGMVYMGPAVRVWLAVVAGAAMIGHGMWLERRRMRTISAALTGTGVATLMTAVFAANLAFSVPVLSRAEAFIGIVMVGAIGVALALRRKSVGLALLAFNGMYLSPYILAGTGDHSLALLSYVLFVTACCMGLAMARKNWDQLRLAAFCAAWIWVLAWSTGNFAELNGHLGLVFISIFFVVFLGDMGTQLWRVMRDDPAQGPAQSESAAYWDAIAAIFSFVNTALMLAACALLLDKAHLTGLWYVSLALAGVMGILSRVIKAEYFSMSAAIQSLTLVVISVPLYFDGVNVTMAWGVLALGMGLYANLRNSELARIFMFGTLVLAGIRCCTMDLTDHGLDGELLRMGGNVITLWMLLGWALGLLAIFLAWLTRPSAPRQADGTTYYVGAAWATVGCVAASTLMVLVVNVRALTPGDSFTVAAVVWVFALIALLRVRALAEIDTALEALVTVLLLLLTGKWFLYDGIGREINGASGVLPVWNMFTLNGLLVAVAMLALNPLRKQPEVARRFIGWWMTALLFAFLNVQVLRSIDYFVPAEVKGVGGPELFKNVSLTVLWALFAAVMTGVGFLRRMPSVRYVALTLLAFTVAKIIAIDMANVDTILRVVSFLMLGTLLFVVSYLYHRHVRELPGGLEAEPAA